MNETKNTKKETHLDSRLLSFNESKNRLKGILNRVQQLEVKLSGDKIRDLKDNEKINCEKIDIPKQSIINDFSILNDDFNEIITNLIDSIDHLEDLI